MTFRVLSIDGGGMRGIYTATYLEEIERSFSGKRKVPQGLDIGKVFRLIVGTSTGAIIGCGLAKGVSPSEMVKLYQKHGPAIFPKKMPIGLSIDLLAQMFKRSDYLRQGDQALHHALAQVFGDMTVG